MSIVEEWNVGAASTADELLMIVASAANGVQTQVLASSVLTDPRFEDVKRRLAQVASDLRGLEYDFALLAAVDPNIR
ncbi:hypothetical protein LMG28614_06205 [Paraburkholderia ultramafica]|uniref:Uncharacterized protein n=1 Tax=Paraburkholderia ultramafica TaxID=1544867 RepID=A0A6S7BM08_9BURK|nr:hypothetical protein [Paraburkholderia ultramafica]CAB3805426.1 hypothetical protein LMG28614_06205 [Paraburkholderia ultramafica]